MPSPKPPAAVGEPPQPQFQPEEGKAPGSFAFELIWSLEHWNQERSREALEALVRMGGAAVPALIVGLARNSDICRMKAAWALRRIGPEAREAVPGLTRALKDRERHVRLAAADALGSIGSAAAAATQALAQACQDWNEDVRGAAARALALIGPKDPACLSALIVLLKDPSMAVRARAMEALRALDLHLRLLERVAPLPAFPPGCVLRRSAIDSALELFEQGHKEDEAAYCLYDRIKEHPQDFVEGYQEGMKEHARCLLLSFQPNLATLIPGGFLLDEEPCLRWLQQYVNGKWPHQATGGIVWNEFVKVIASHGEQFSASYSVWLDQHAQAEFSRLRTRLDTQVPSGCQLNEWACLEQIKLLLKQQKSSGNLIELLAEQVVNDPHAFVLGFRDWVAGQAQELFRVLKGRLRHSLGEGRRLLKKPCLDLLVTLVSRRTPPQILFDAAIEAIRQAPGVYFDDDSNRSQEYLKARIRSSEQEARLKCPFCGVKVAAKNLLRHCDQHHASDYQ
jgi:hypothetical protein